MLLGVHLHFTQSSERHVLQSYKLIRVIFVVCLHLDTSSEVGLTFTCSLVR